MFDTIGTPYLWLGFLGFVFVMLAIDLGVFNKKEHTISMREAGAWSVVWVVLSMCFAGFVYYKFGEQRALEFTTGYLLEKALAVDNIFVFVLLFATFKIPPIYQHRVLFWGVLGALIMRAAFILAGGAFVQRFHWAMYVFGGILLFSGLKLLFGKDEEEKPADNIAVRFLSRLIPSTKELEGGHFFVRRDTRLLATPLFTTLVAVEISDLVFAVDSIPAIFAVTTDPFIVFTSNICAILGLRAMYFLLAAVIDRFHYLKIGLSFVLVFVGAKMVIMDWYKLPILWSLGTIVGILAASIIFSLVKKPVIPSELAPHPDVPGPGEA